MSPADIPGVLRVASSHEIDQLPTPRAPPAPLLPPFTPPPPPSPPPRGRPQVADYPGFDQRPQPGVARGPAAAPGRTARRHPPVGRRDRSSAAGDRGGGRHAAQHVGRRLLVDDARLRPAAGQDPGRNRPDRSAHCRRSPGRRGRARPPALGGLTPAGSDAASASRCFHAPRRRTRALTHPPHHSTAPNRKDRAMTTQTSGGCGPGRDARALLRDEDLMRRRRHHRP